MKGGGYNKLAWFIYIRNQPDILYHTGFPWVSARVAGDGVGPPFRELSTCTLWWCHWKWHYHVAGIAHNTLAFRGNYGKTNSVLPPARALLQWFHFWVMSLLQGHHVRCPCLGAGFHLSDSWLVVGKCPSKIRGSLAPGRNLGTLESAAMWFLSM